MIRRARPEQVNSTYRATIHSELIKISDNIDFGQDFFKGRMKRNRSLGSVQALIVELALTHPEVKEHMRKVLKRYMIGGGKNWTPETWYGDMYPR